MRALLGFDWAWIVYAKTSNCAICSCLDDKGMDGAVKDIIDNKVAKGYEGVPSSQNEEDD